ncbi:MAG TPA: hypothetical protein VN948_16150 [Terriglobales bacterium]|nr:hypothetical protein [Terriglobales bacterium]
MKFPHLFEIIAGLALVALSLFATPAATTQTIIGNETLVTTTFVVNKKPATAQCGTAGCRAKTSMFAPIRVTCPAATGQTCTFHISLDTKTSIGFPCGAGCEEQGPTGFYQFLVDGIAPTIGPTDKNGDYIIGKNVITWSNGSPFEARQSYPASVLATVTNASANSSHRIAVSVGCADTVPEGGCEATAHWSTMTVDVFEP